MPRRLAALPALLLLLLAACTGGRDGTETSAATAAEDVPGTIVVASGRDVTGSNGVRQQLIDAWNRRERQAGSQYRARLVELAGSADEQRSQLLGALQSRSAEYDVVNLDVTWVPEFAEAGLVRALPDDIVDEDVIGPVAETARWDGKVYAAPFNSDVGLLYYRRDLLRRAGVEEPFVPEGFTWDQLRGHVETLHTKLPAGAFTKGWTTQLAAYEGRTVNAVEAFASAVPGLTLVDEKGRYTGDVEQLTEGVAELRRRIEPAYTLQDAATSDEAAATSDFVEGRTAFLRAWPSAYPTLYRVFGDRVGVAKLPGRAVLGGQNLAVTKASQRARKATELIRYLTGRESARCLLEAGFAATRDSAYRDVVRCPEGVSAAPSPSPTGEGADQVPRDGGGRPAHADTTLRALEEAVHRPRTPLYGALTQTFITRLGPLVDGAPLGDEELARLLDEGLRGALPG
ncbi:extracellular solute-binding protein [Streptomyces sp. MA15]|uniref:extracellular solute-binding protein n=1 Tax=Streptomyces sp. MA15 TaxID=3055061 RepID=UPI0025B26FE4|nr:extracellular solute-binding protein [Streptomyces sp. MA15]MDN3266673.1 extracellular solute-binding protein [Streptomyces sp. MA15]